MLLINQMVYKGASHGVGQKKGKGEVSEAMQREGSMDKREKCRLRSQWEVNLESDPVH